jgi:glutamate:GABA antiporter
VVPRPDEPDKVLAVIKIVGMTAVMLAGGVAIYVGGKRRARRVARLVAAVGS